MPEADLIHYAMNALGSSWRCLIYSGENLSLINQSMPDRTKMIVSKWTVQMQPADTRYHSSFMFYNPLEQAQ